MHKTSFNFQSTTEKTGRLKFESETDERGFQISIIDGVGELNPNDGANIANIAGPSNPKQIINIKCRSLISEYQSLTCSK